MPIYKGRTRGTWRVVVWAQGVRHEQVVSGSKRDAESHEARMRLELDAGRLSRRVAPTFSDFCVQEYAPYAETNLKGSTWSKVRIYQVATLIDFFGPMRLNAITTAEVEAFKRKRLKDVRERAINNELRVLRAIRRWAEKSQGFPVAECEFKMLTPRGSPRVRVWTETELDRLFEEARKEQKPLLEMLIFLVNTGCRKGEALAAEWSWVDLAAGFIRIPSNEVWQPKNGKPREVPISDVCRTVLTQGNSPWLFPSRHGGRYTDFPKDMFWAARDRAGLQGGPHTLRHTFASNFLQAVPDLFLLSKVLGHSHQRITELYAHLLPGHLERARNAVNIGPPLKTVATTVAETGKTRVLPAKVGKRH